MRLPGSARRPVVFTIDTGDGGQPQKRATLTLDRATAATIRWETFADNNAGRRLRSWSRFVHTGEAFGVAGQTLAGAGSLGGVVLVWTGIALALRRLWAWRRRQIYAVSGTPLSRAVAQVGSLAAAQVRIRVAHVACVAGLKRRSLHSL